MISRLVDLWKYAFTVFGENRKPESRKNSGMMKQRRKSLTDSSALCTITTSMIAIPFNVSTQVIREAIMCVLSFILHTGLLSACSCRRTEKRDDNFIASDMGFFTGDFRNRHARTVNIPAGGYNALDA